MLKIITVPNEILSSPTKPISKIDEKIKNLVMEMEETLVNQKNPKGVGLAANQVGENISLFIIKPTGKAKTKVFINPKILEKKMYNVTRLKFKNNRKRPVKLEGCLSIPRIWGSVKRSSKILIQYQDLTGITKKEWFNGFESVIIQHEIDHLNGIVFTQRSMEQNQKLYKEDGDELKPIEV